MKLIKSTMLATALAATSFAAAPASAAEYSEQHVEWCQKTFTDYNVSDNTYGNDTGDVQKLCSSPYEDKNDVVMRTVENPSFELAETGKTYANSHKEWCRKTHPTWNVNSNTYMTDNGMEKACSSPFN